MVSRIKLTIIQKRKSEEGIVENRIPLGVVIEDQGKLKNDVKGYQNCDAADCLKSEYFIDGNKKNDKYFKMKVESSGKYSRKSEMDDIASFAKRESMDSNDLINWLETYLEQSNPKKLKMPNSLPRKVCIRDDKKKGIDLFSKYGWKPIKLTLQPGIVDVRKQWTKESRLEQIEWNHSKDLNTVLMEVGNKEVTSTLRKSKLGGHPLAKSILKSNTEIVTEFRGIDSITSTLHNQKAAQLDQETGASLWRDSKKLREMLEDFPLLQKTSEGVSWSINIFALESYVKARVYYKASFSGSITTDHGNEKFDGRRYWNWDLKYLLRANGIQNAIAMYEDVELHFFTNVRIHVENQDWEWVRGNGQWMKQKPTDF